MTTVQQFRLPDVGEGLTEAEIVTWRVAVGDVVAVNDPIVEVETAKSIVELPSPWAGTVDRLLVAEGRTVDVGTPLIAVTVESEDGDGDGDGGAGGGAPPAEPAEAAPDGQGASGVEGGPPATEPSGAVLVGYGVREGHRPRRHRRPARAAGATAAAARELARGEVPPPPVTGATPVGAAPLAKPPVRALARDLGLDLAAVTGTGTGGAITREDLLAHSSPAPAGAGAPAQPGAAARETRTPIRGVRKATAAQVVASAFTAPHATAFITVDATRTMKLLDRLRADRAFEGVHVSPLLVVAKAMCLAVVRNPAINAVWDEAAQEIVTKHYVNLGIAVATQRGLLVPSVKDAERLGLRDLAGALTDLVRTTRAGKATPADLSGSTVSITNIGVFGVDTGTPILNAGEAAILCIGAIRQRPWVHKGKVRPRWVAELSLSFDHRLVDGDLGSKFLADVAAVLERPDRALVWS